MSDPTLIHLLRGRPSPPFGVRVRILLDLLGELVAAGGGPLEPRVASSRLCIDHVRIAPTGVSRIDAGGDTSGAALLAWEVLLSLPLMRDASSVPARARAALERENADVAAVLDAALKYVPGLTRIEQLFDALSRAAQGTLASYDDVLAALGLSPAGASERPGPPRTGAERSPVDRQAAAWRSLAAKAASERGGKQGGAAGAPPPAPAPSASPPSARSPSMPSAPASASGRSPTIPAAPTPAAVRTPTMPVLSSSSSRSSRSSALPAAPAPLSLETPPSSAHRRSGAPSAAVARRGFLIVLADDAERHRLAEAVRDAGHRVVDLADSDTAFAAAVAAPPLGIVADIDLRPESGDELARRVRMQAGALADTPFVLLVPPGAAQARVAPFATGADVKLPRPVLPHDLVSELRCLVTLAPLLRAARAALPSLGAFADAGLRGDFRTMSLDVLLALLEVERRTGLVRAATARGTLCVELRAGLMVRGAIRGEVVTAFTALHAMAALKEGPFTFYPLPAKPTPRDAVAPHVLLSAVTRGGEPSEADSTSRPASRRP